MELGLQFNPTPPFSILYNTKFHVVIELTLFGWKCSSTSIFATKHSLNGKGRLRRLLTKLMIATNFLFPSTRSQHRLTLKFKYLLLFPPPNLTFNRHLLPRTPIMFPPNQTNQFPSPQSLSEWLKPRLPLTSLSSWGTTPGTKNVHNLWLELSQGESSLTHSTPPVRTVQVLSITIKDNTRQRTLLESHQELSDGSIRQRSRPLSEKMKPKESVEEGVVRAIKEELGGSLNVRIMPGTYSKKVEERVSLSYPGLPACYILHCVDAVVDGLPDGDFCTEEDEYGHGTGSAEASEVAEKAVSVKKHFWKWVGSGLD